jgi:hypothetical protein
MDNKLFMYVESGRTEWEDMILFTDEEEAIAYSKKKPEGRVEIFVKAQGKGYIPSYAYLRNGFLHVGAELVE